MKKKPEDIAARELEIAQYRQLVNEVYGNKEIKSFPDVSPYRDNLKLLFYCYEVRDKNFDPNTSEHVDRSVRAIFIEELIKLVKFIDNKKIDVRTLNTINIVADYNYEALKYLRTIYAPEKYYNDTIINYYYSFKCLLTRGCKYWKRYPVDTGNEILDEYYAYVRDIYNKSYSLFFEYSDGIYTRTIGLIMSILHLKKKFSKELFYKYMDNLDYYVEKLDLYGFSDRDTDELYPYVYDNFDTIFQVDDVFIK